MPSQQVNHLKLINRTSYQTGDHMLETELGYQHNFRQEFSQYVNHGYMPPVYPDNMRIPATLEREYDKHVYSANLRDRISFGKHELTIGLNGEHQDNAINGWTFLVPGYKQTTAGGFAYDKSKLSEKVFLHGAIRYDHGQVRLFKYSDWFESPVTENGVTTLKELVRANDLTRNFNSFVWSLGLNYNPDQFSLKFNIGKSFRMPITKEFGANGVNYHYFSYELGEPTLNLERSYQADLSVGWNEAKWSVQISPFYNYFPNYIYLNPTPDHSPGAGGGNQIFQYAQSRVVRYGGELQLKYRPLESLSTEFLAEYLYAEQLSGNKKGFTLPFSPPPSALFNVTWSPNLSTHLQGTYVSLDYRITAAQNNIVPPEKKTAGYRVINLQAGTKLHLYKQPVVISLQAQNLLNTRYLNHTSFYRLIELPEAGRNIILSLKVPFLIRSSQPKQAI
ncbi:TonB-dependent receptor [Mucilaginibacter sp. PAMB04274]|uniref:TonB-dependent receptor domain-containing protein n=1 Tax=Mucilaginibacter sp. PAMB04274 TaxID=3138568 RepID=UPI0031F6FF6C